MEERHSKKTNMSSAIINDNKKDNALGKNKNHNFDGLISN